METIMTKIKKEQINKYMKIQYRIELIPDKVDGGFVVKIPDLPGCLSQGETVKEALEQIEAAKEAWLEAALQSKKKIPLPRERFSGKLNIRIPKSLHKRLFEEAEREGVSLNSEIMATLERGLMVGV